MRKLLLSLASVALSMGMAAQYTNGYFIVNEGQYGSEPGLLNFYSNETGEVTGMVYQEASGGNTLGMTAQFGALADGKLFICSKQNFGNGGRLVVADAKTLQTLANHTAIDDDADTRGIGVATDAGKFFVGSTKGVYAYDLSTLEQIGIVEGTAIDGGAYSAGSGDMVYHNGMMYVAQPDGVMVIDPTTNALKTTIEIENATSVFVVNGQLYAAVNSCSWGTPTADDTEQFVAINNDNTLGTVHTVPMASPNMWFTPKPCKPVAVMGENAIVYSPGENTKNLCKYDFDTQTFTQDFVTFEGRQQMYGHVLLSDEKTGDILACTFQSYGSTNYWFNIYDGATGEVKSSKKMPAHMWFTTQIIKAMDDTSTGVNGLATDANQIVAVKYCNLAGQMSDTPFKGVNIVVSRHADGSTTSSKAIF